MKGSSVTLVIDDPFYLLQLCETFTYKKQELKVEQIHTCCLAQSDHYIESNVEAAMIDPRREITHYPEKATMDRAHIKYVLETHIHEDIVSVLPPCVQEGSII